jgi:hypothetical protein
MGGKLADVGGEWRIVSSSAANRGRDEITKSVARVGEYRLGEISGVGAGGSVLLGVADSNTIAEAGGLEKLLVLSIATGPGDLVFLVDSTSRGERDPVFAETAQRSTISGDSS